MAKLDASDRKKMAKSDFAEPGKRAFPISDPTHARLAISGATRSENAGNIGPEEAAKIKTKARAKLGKKRPMGKGKLSAAIESAMSGAAKDPGINEAVNDD